GVPRIRKLDEAVTQFWLRAAQLLEEHICARDEHAAVPQVVARGEVALGDREGRLLDEGVDGDRARRALQLELAAAVDVAEADRGLRRRYPDRGDVAGIRRRDRLDDRTPEPPHIADDMVGGERADDNAGLPLLEYGRG